MHHVLFGNHKVPAWEIAGGIRHFLFCFSDKTLYYEMRDSEGSIFPYRHHKTFYVS